jgi:hypothetical protein
MLHKRNHNFVRIKQNATILEAMAASIKEELWGAEFTAARCTLDSDIGLQEYLIIY